MQAKLKVPQSDLFYCPLRRSIKSWVNPHQKQRQSYMLWPLVGLGCGWGPYFAMVAAGLSSSGRAMATCCSWYKVILCEIEWRSYSAPSPSAEEVVSSNVPIGRLRTYKPCFFSRKKFQWKILTLFCSYGWSRVTMALFLERDVAVFFNAVPQT